MNGRPIVSINGRSFSQEALSPETKEFLTPVSPSWSYAPRHSSKSQMLVAIVQIDVASLDASSAHRGMITSTLDGGCCSDRRRSALVTGLESGCEVETRANLR